MKLFAIYLTYHLFEIRMIKLSSNTSRYIEAKSGVVSVVGSTRVSLFDFFWSGYSIVCTVESLSLFYLLFMILIYMYLEMIHG